MAVTTGNFQDLVQLSQDTLYHLGPMFQVGDPSASTVTVGYSNSGGVLALAATQTANETVWLPQGGTLLSNINISAGTTSSNVSALTFSNGSGVTFGFDGTNITASVVDAGAVAAIAAGTQTGTSGTIVFSNSNNVTFGMSGSTRVTASAALNISSGTPSKNLSAVTFSNTNDVSFGLNGSTVTANAQVNISAGTTSNNLSAVTFSNSNGISFGMNGSTVTAVFGGMSSWSNGQPSTALTGGQNTLFFQPIIVPYALTATNLIWLLSVSNKSSNVSGGLSVSAALYTLNGGTTGSLSLASSGSTNLTWTSGAALSSNTGINYQQMSVNSWAITPGAYLFAWWISTQGSATVSYYGPAQPPSISSGQVAAMSNLMLPGYSQATTNALPSSFGLSNTASYIRTGATAAEQPFIIMQGT